MSLWSFSSGGNTRETAYRVQCAHQLKQIGIALSNYAEVYGAFPPAYTTDASGKRLHSWRTLILPFMEVGPFYHSIDLSKPWDDPVNASARTSVVPSYRCTSTAYDPDKLNHTTYMAIVSPNSCFRPGKSTGPSDVTDNLSGTLMLIEVDDEHAVPWMSPFDVDEQFVLGMGSGSKPRHDDGVHAVFADGRVQLLDANTPEDQLRSLLTIAGGEQSELDANE